MSKPRFDDPDLHTPAHDAIMLWLDEHAKEIVSGLAGFEAISLGRKEATKRQLASLDGLTFLDDDFNKLLAETGQEVGVKTTWEHPIQSHDRSTRYIDLFIKAWCSVPLLERTNQIYDDELTPERRQLLEDGGWEENRDGWRRKTVWHDTLIHAPVRRGVDLWLGTATSIGYTLACEVKPVIRSVGELIRQLRQYESSKWKVAVVSPDDRFREIIEKQGFIFIKAPQPDYGPQGGLF